MTRAHTTIALAASLASACGLIVDPGRHVGSGTDASREDAGPQQLPSAPEISIAPEAPATTDALVARIDVESVDPAGRTITYEHAWQRDGAAAGVTTERVQPEATRKGETWTVRVTPVTDDGRRGPAGEAEVTIVNTRPTITSVGLSSYRPVLNDSLLALPCGAADVDGDRPRVELTWRIGGTPAVATGSRLVLAGGLAPVGATIEVEAVAIDDEGARSEPVAAGPAIVLDDVTRWVQLLPNTDGIVYSMHDPAHCRVLHVVEEGTEKQLWEHLPDEGRWVRLRPEGDPTNPNWPLVFPDGSGRFYLVGDTRLDDSGVFRVVELDARRRGREAWRDLPLDGQQPSDASVLSGVHDPERGAMVFATLGATGLDVWTAEAGERATLTRHASSTAPGALGATWVQLPGTRRVVAFGGIDFGSGGLGGTPNDLVHELDLDDLARGLTETGARMPAPVALPMGLADPSRGRVLVGFGFREGFALASRFYAFDVTSGSFSDLDAASGPRTALFGFMSPDGDRALVFPRFDGGTESAVPDLYGLDPASATWEPVLVGGRDHPRPVVGAIGGFVQDELTFYGGVDSRGDVREELWRANVLAGADFRRFTRVVVAPDPSAGAPGPRWGVPLAAGLARLAVIGGRDGPMPGDYADTEIWEIVGDAWRRRTLAAGSTPPAPRAGGIVASLPGGCAGEIAVLGGLTSAGPSDEVHTLACAPACAWTAESTTGDAIPRHDAGLGRFGTSEVVVVGGWGAHGSATAYDPCARTWRELTIDGGPFERIEHTVDGDLVFGGSDPEGFVAVPVNTAHRIVRVDANTVRFDRVDVATDGDGEPAPRALHVSGYDEERGRLFVYGGGAGRPRSDLWVLRLR